MNGGVCSNGECKCRKLYSGSNCQYKEVAESNFFWYFIVFLILAAIIVALFIGAMVLIKKAGALKEKYAAE